VKKINLRATLECGQVFHWTERSAGVWEGLIGDDLAVVREKGGRLEVVSGNAGRCAEYFGLDDDLEGIYEGFFPGTRPCLRPWSFVGVCG